MRIKFRVLESLEEIIEKAINSQYYQFSFSNGKNELLINYSFDGFLTDFDFQSSAVFNGCIDHHGEGYIYLTTFWSSFTYKFESRNNKTYCTYDGAYNGFLKQDLNFQFTPVLDGTETVQSSLTPKTVNLIEYKNIQSKLQKLKDGINAEFADRY
jgi:hypothetical protein